MPGPNRPEDLAIATAGAVVESRSALRSSEL